MKRSDYNIILLERFIVEVATSDEEVIKLKQLAEEFISKDFLFGVMKDNDDNNINLFN